MYPEKKFCDDNILLQPLQHICGLMFMINNLKSIVTIGAALLSVTLIFGQTSKRALFLGNSYTAYNSLPQLTADIAASAGDTLEFDSNTPGGTSFSSHSVNATSISKIEQGNWDFVVLQEQSQIPSFPLGQVETDCFPFAEQLVEMIEENNPCATPMFYMTWGRENGDAQNCPNWPPVCTYEGMDDLLHERYMMLGEMNNGIVSPVGAVWRHLRENFPDLVLYASDGSHPSPLGSYVAGLCMYTCIFRHDPLNADFNYTTDDDEELIAREVVHELVFNNLAQWYIGDYDPLASFEIQPVDNLTYQLNNTSENATEYTWILNDEIITPDAQGIILLPSAGVYELTLIATRCGLSSSVSQTIDTTTNSIAIQNTPTPALFPVPADQFVRIKGIGNSNWRLTNSAGIVVEELRLTNDTFDTSMLANGIYFLQCHGATYRLIIAH